MLKTSSFKYYVTPSMSPELENRHVGTTTLILQTNHGSLLLSYISRNAVKLERDGESA